MSAFYDRFVATAIRMVAKYGTNVYHTQYSSGGGDYNPSTSTGAPILSSAITRKGLLTEQPGNRINRRDGQILQDGSLIQTGDKWVYLVPDAAAPMLQDRITVLTIPYVIKDIQVYGPDGTPLLYLCVLRK